MEESSSDVIVLERGEMKKWKLVKTDQIRVEDQYKCVTRMWYDTRTCGK